MAMDGLGNDMMNEEWDGGAIIKGRVPNARGISVELKKIMPLLLVLLKQLVPRGKANLNLPSPPYLVSRHIFLHHSHS